MGHLMTRRQLFIAKCVERFPILYQANHAAQFHKQEVMAAYEAIAAVAIAADFPDLTALTIKNEFSLLRNKYYYVQYRLHNGHLLINMASIQLQTQIVCHYWCPNIFHHNFINMDVRQLAEAELMVRHGWIYALGQAVAAVLHLLPPLSVAAAHQQPQVQVPPALLHGPILDPVGGQYSLVRRRAGDDIDLLILKDLIKEHDTPDPVPGQYLLVRRRAGDYIDLLILEDLIEERDTPDPPM